MILTRAGQSQQFSHMCTWKISGVFRRIQTHDLCIAGAVLLPKGGKRRPSYLTNFTAIICMNTDIKLQLAPLSLVTSQSRRPLKEWYWYLIKKNSRF